MGVAFHAGKMSSLAVDPGYRRVLPDIGQRHQTAGQAVATLAVLDLFGLVEVISHDEWMLSGFSSKVRLPIRLL